jgi:hypothetical protein
MKRAEELKKIMDDFYAKHPEAKEAVELMEQSYEPLKIYEAAADALEPKYIFTTGTTSKETRL